jgi:hypothetical protein
MSSHPCYGGQTILGSTDKVFIVALPILANVATSALGCAFVGGWHGGAIAYSHSAHRVEHRSAHLPCSFSLRRSANVLPSKPRRAMRTLSLLYICALMGRLAVS